ncbi:carboxypeptidase regulatory-like domain-containing protein [Deinococcus alpinitundrae]|uniref:carboxypeptidase regulatory-like domain-containing protein n=1 Tax=Deinococcus alpinitundrae TaxID=468913 RepID=UPI001ED909AE|nr:carboxypeptidase regulatory-like domain-containing protein [Deinococcus alpinitundrae]
MRLRRATFILALTLGLLPYAHAQVQMSATATGVTERQTASLAVRLVNTDAAPRDVQLQLILPAGWQTLIAPRTLTLAPGEDTVEVIVVRVPRTAQAGVHTVGVTVDDVKAQAEVRVPQRDAVDVRALASSVTGGQVEASFQVRNDGNAPTHVDLSAAGQGKPRVTPAALDLAPGEIRNVQVTGPVPPGLAKYSVTVRARTPKAAAQASISADVLTAAPNARSAWQTLAAEVQVEAGPGGPQIRFSADGAVAAGVNVHLRATPQSLEAEVRTQSARLALGNATPGFSSFTVRPSALALQGELGTGTVGSNTVRAYVGLRRDVQGEPVTGLELGRRYGWGDARVGVDVVGGRVTATLAARAVMPTLTARGELGLRGDGVAVAVDADAVLKNNALGLSGAGASATYRSPGFGGTAPGRASMEMHARGQIKTFGVGASLSGGVELASGNVIPARTLEFAVRVQNTQLSLDGGLKWSEKLTLQEANLTADVGLGYRLKGGQWQQNVTNQQSFKAGVQVTNSLKYGVSLEYTFGKNVNTVTVHSKTDVTLDLLSGKTRVGTSLEGRWVGGSGTRVDVGISQPDFSQRGLSLSAAVEHPLANGTILLASMSQYVGVTSSTSFRVAARIPLNIPLYPRPDIGGVEGRVLDGRGQGIAGVTVQVMSFLAVTDAQGTYHFPALPQGDHVLQVRAPKGQWCTPPQAVSVRGRQVARQNLTCTPSASITAQLVVHTVGETAEAPLELPGVVVTLNGPLGRFVATSDASGRLSFEDLPTSMYQLEITPATPGQFRNLTIETPGTVSVASGPAELSFRFGRKPRVIQMQDEAPVMVPLTPLPSVPVKDPAGAP